MTVDFVSTSGGRTAEIQGGRVVLRGAIWSGTYPLSEIPRLIAFYEDRCKPYNAKPPPNRRVEPEQYYRGWVEVLKACRDFLSSAPATEAKP